MKDSLLFLWISPFSKHRWPVTLLSPYLSSSNFGVCFGGVEFRLSSDRSLLLLAIALNKVLLTFQHGWVQFMLWHFHVSSLAWITRDILHDTGKQKWDSSHIIFTLRSVQGSKYCCSSHLFVPGLLTHVIVVQKQLGLQLLQSCWISFSVNKSIVNVCCK